MSDYFFSMELFDSFSGSVIHGTKMGRTMGFPTLNIAVNQGNIPKDGVYAVSVNIGGNQHVGIMSVGHRPTFSDKNNKTTEIHLLYVNKDYYGVTAAVTPLLFIRPNIKFNSAAELKSQIEKDKKFVEEYFDANSCNS